MRPTSVMNRTAIALIALAGAASNVIAQNEQPAAQPEPVRTLFAFEHGSCEDMLKSPKDAALLAALKLVPVRVTEIMNTPGLGPNKDEVPEGIVELVTQALTGPARMAVIQQGFDERSRMPKIGFVLSYKAADEQAAKAMMTRVENVRRFADRGNQMNPQASKRFEGMNAVVTPPGTVLWGPRKAADGWRFEVMFGNVPDPDGAFWGALPGDKSAAARAIIDMPAITPVAEMFGGMASSMIPNGEEVLQGLRDYGIMGPEAMSVEMVWSHSAEGAVSTTTVRRAGKYADKIGLVKQTVSEADLSVIPADAFFASVSKVDPQGTWGRLRTMAAQANPGGEGPNLDFVIGEINKQLGIDFEKDVIASLGHTASVALSDTTGGNSLFSGVGFIEVKDPERMGAALRKAADAANRFIQEEQKNEPAPGTVRIESWASAGIEGVKFLSVRSPGLPVPIEPTLAMVDRWLIVGLSPQSCMSAAAHAAAKKPGLASNAAFAEHAKGVVGSATGVTFLNSAETMRDGYPVLQMLGSALTNFARSPEPSGGRQVAQVVPNLAELRSGTRPIVYVTRWNGDDLVITSNADGSMLANAAGLLGTGDLGSILFGAFVGGAVGHESGEKQGYSRGHWAGSQEGKHEHMQIEGEEPEMMEPAEAPEAPEAPEASEAPEAPEAPEAKAPAGNPA